MSFWTTHKLKQLCQDLQEYIPDGQSQAGDAIANHIGVDSKNFKLMLNGDLPITPSCGNRLDALPIYVDEMKKTRTKN